MENYSSKGKIRKNMSSLLARNRGRSTKKTNRMSSSPMSLLDRFREAVFRLIMVSALSSSTTHRGQRVDTRGSNNYYNCYKEEPHRSQDVADCIEFIKKSAYSNERCYSMGASPDEVVIPVPVM
ncbi:hypothetical protein LIER_32753 [Lithospermum erythrorhizon]|uniref:Uncharacterized protein n=1 Tax=Lithospermum erythrorhizon TaxID=34254 RepID=A0AAV3RY53_LITER